MERWLALSVLLPLAAWPGVGRAEMVRAHYATYAAGLNVMRMDAALDLTAGRYRLELELQTAGTFALFNKTRILSRADGRFDGGLAAPGRFYSAGTLKGEQRLTLIEYEGGQPAIKTLAPVEEADRAAVPGEMQRDTVDTLSAMAQLLAQVNRTGTCEGSLRTFDGRRLAVLRAWTMGEEVLEATSRSSFAGSALHCGFEGRQLGGFKSDESLAAQQRPQLGGAWFASVAPGGPKIPVRISFHTRWFGDAVMYLAPGG